MPNKRSEQSEALEEVIESIHQMDDSLLEVSKLENKSKYAHSFKKWYESMKAIHDIKLALHKVDMYEQFDQNDFESFKKEHQTE